MMVVLFISNPFCPICSEAFAPLQLQIAPILHSFVQYRVCPAMSKSNNKFQRVM